MSEDKNENKETEVNPNRAKMGWLRPAMNGSDEGLINQLLGVLPATESVNHQGLAQLEQARLVMAELWLRGVSLGQFYEETGLTGAPKDLLPAGFSKQKGRSAPVYFKLFLTEKDPKICAAGLKDLLLGRMKQMGEWADQFRMLFFVDIDSENKEFPSPYESGLTPHAVCFDVSMADIESCFTAIDEAASVVAGNSVRNLRIGIGQFGPEEYIGMRNGYLFTKRMSFNMGSEWLLVKNIARRAGKLGWFWRFVARQYERYDNP